MGPKDALKPQLSASFDELVKEADSLIELFKQHDPRPWPLEAKGLDLAVHLGIIEQVLLENRGYKPKKENGDKLATALATLFFITLDIANDSEVNFKDAFGRFLKETKKSLT